MSQVAQPQASTSPSVALVLDALGETRAQIGAAFFRYESPEEVLALDGYQVMSAAESALLAESGPHAWTGPSPVARAARGLTSEYVARLGRDAGWPASASLPVSAYFVPVVREEVLLGVLAFFRRGEDSLTEAVRPLLELVAQIVAKVEGAEENLRARNRGVEACFGRFVSEMGRLGYGSTRAPVRSGETPLDTSTMTSREQEVLQIFLFHGEISAIAERLEISPHTVRNHLKAIYRKLGVHSQAELLRRLQFEASPET